MLETPTPTLMDHSAPMPKRVRLRFSLRALLVLTLVVGLGVAWLTSEFNKRQTNARILAEFDVLRSLGCRIEYQGSKSVQSNWLDQFLGPSQTGIADSVDCNRKPITDAQLKHVSRLTHLRHLRLCNTAITDAGLAHLKGLKNLESLDLHGTSVTDAGLEHLKDLTNLRELVTSQGFSFKGMANLKTALPNLQSMSIAE
jgi:Leucine rich repeat